MSHWSGATVAGAPTARSQQEHPGNARLFLVPGSFALDGSAYPLITKRQG